MGKQCGKYLVEHGFIATEDEFFCSRPPKDAPLFIISWIMDVYVILSTADFLSNLIYAVGVMKQILWMVPKGLLMQRQKVTAMHRSYEQL